MYRKCFIFLKVATGILLALFFFFNSWIIFIHYIEGKTITSSNVVINKKGKQLLPAIVVCRKKAYGSTREMSRLEDFLNNTMNLLYYVRDEEYNWIERNSTKFIWGSVYSYNRGHCYVLKYIKEVTHI